MPPNNLRKPVAKFTDFIRFTLNKMRRLFSGSSLIGSPHIGQISPGSRYVSVLYGRFIFPMIPFSFGHSVLGEL